MNKLLALLLGISLAGNLWLWRRSTTAGPESSLLSSSGGQSAAGATAAAANVKTKSAQTDALAALQTLDPASLCAALRASGMSREMIRAIVAARIRQQHQAELAATEIPGEKDIWWRMLYNSPSAREMNDKREKLNEQIRAEINAVLGETPPNPVANDPRYKFLSPEKALALQQIERDYSDLLRRTSASGRVSSEEAKVLDQEKQRDLAALLSPDELKEYDLRFSPAAMQLKMRLGPIDGTEAEYRWLYDQQQRYSALYKSTPVNTPSTSDAARARDAALTQLQTDVLNQLGPERGADYLWQNDQDYQRLRSAARDNVIGSDVPGKIMALRDDTGRNSYAIAQDTTLSGEQKQAALTALAANARAQLNALVPAQAGAVLTSPPWLQGLEQGRAMRWDPLISSTSSTTVFRPNPPKG